MTSYSCSFIQCPPDYPSHYIPNTSPIIMFICLMSHIHVTNHYSHMSSIIMFIFPTRLQSLFSYVFKHHSHICFILSPIIIRICLQSLLLFSYLSHICLMSHIHVSNHYSHIRVSNRHVHISPIIIIIILICLMLTIQIKKPPLLSKGGHHILLYLFN